MPLFSKSPSAVRLAAIIVLVCNLPAANIANGEGLLSRLAKAAGRTAIRAPGAQGVSKSGTSQRWATRPEQLEVLNQRVEFLARQGSLPQAEKLARTALEQQPAPPDEKKAAVARATSNLGVILLAQDRYEEAEPLLEKAVSIRQALPNADKNLIADSLSNLAALRRAQGRLDDADKLYSEALEIRNALLGPHHPSTQHCLARCDEIRKMQQTRSHNP